ncbi:uncharacterized protein HaLaN_29732 [Haematococcus lacustris]|uniref:Uncharacterized protein n=1 Tax=Haematococcus lacustris TaxID=44745 RepID=A0A6A0AD56_HAELA|nr:uncharacterized protein HaLaN_29732 [Haematococcus lacustris]
MQPTPKPGTTGAGAQAQALRQLQPKGAQVKKPRRRVLTSLPLQVFIFFGGWWDVLYFVLNILTFVYKGVTLPYPQRNYVLEFLFAWLWVLIDAPRLFLGEELSKLQGVDTQTLMNSFIDRTRIRGAHACLPVQQARETKQSKLDPCCSPLSSPFPCWACTSTTSASRPMLKLDVFLNTGALVFMGLQV